MTNQNIKPVTVSLPLSYISRPDCFALFNKVAIPACPKDETIKAEGLVEGIDFPAHKNRVKAEYKAMLEMGVKCAIVFLSSVDMRKAMREHSELFRIDEEGVWNWTGTTPLWYVDQCLRDYDSYRLAPQTYDYKDLPKNFGTSGNSRSDATEKKALRACEIFLGMTDLEWVGQERTGKNGSYFPDVVHKIDDMVDFILEVKGFGGKFCVNPKTVAAARARSKRNVIIE